MRTLTILFAMMLTTTASAQENLQRQASKKSVEKTFTAVKELPITSVKNQHRSGACWDYATLGYLESEILRKTGKTYDHVMLIYGKAIDEQGKPYYMVKNSWDKSGQYKGIWYMSREYIQLNTTYLFLNRDALPKPLRKAIKVHAF